MRWVRVRSRLTLTLQPIPRQHKLAHDEEDSLPLLALPCGFLWFYFHAANQVFVRPHHLLTCGFTKILHIAIHCVAVISDKAVLPITYLLQETRLLYKTAKQRAELANQHAPRHRIPLG